jgi:rhamnose utilization protein RhaD (predicted bifunctional aldolase and dehydrogenase)
MFLPAFIKKEKVKEIRLEIPSYSEQYNQYIEKNKQKEQKETVIHIQIY